MNRSYFTSRRSSVIAVVLYLFGALTWVLFAANAIAYRFDLREFLGTLISFFLFWPFLTLVALVDPELSAVALGIGSSALFFLFVIFVVHAIRQKVGGSTVRPKE